MKKSGDITIEGNNINVKGSGNITMKASKILEN
jgi:type VI secretion system secreted protein VgrG